MGLGAQDLFTEAKGAFTGAVSASMLKSSGCEYVLAGHSERRTVFGEVIHRCAGFRAFWVPITPCLKRLCSLVR